MVKGPACQYTIKISYVEDYRLQKALRLLQVKNKQELQEALRYMLMETVEELLIEKPEKQQRERKKRSALLHLIPGYTYGKLIGDISRIADGIEDLAEEDTE